MPQMIQASSSSSSLQLRTYHQTSLVSFDGSEMKRTFLLVLFLGAQFYCGWTKPVYYEDDVIGNLNQDDGLSYIKTWVRHRQLDLSLPRNGEIFEGDMVMDNRLRRSVKGVELKRSAVIGSNYRWHDGIVPYVFDSSLVDKVRVGIIKAIKEYHKHTCIRFTPRKQEQDYVVFVSKRHKCSSNVGRQGGAQNITLGSGCSRLGTILHEMMHCLGIIHEQSRPDRDNHVIVVTENVDKKYMHNFEKYSYEDATNLNVPYNYASLMHYGNDAFSRNGKETLVARNDPNLTFGQRIMFTQGDTDQINKLYNCRAAKSDKGPRSEHFSRKLIPNMYDTSGTYY